MRKITYILSFVFFWLQYSFWFGKNGVCDFFRIKNDANIKVLNNLRVELKHRNDKLIFRINDFLNNQEESIEEHARNELGLIKSDEVFYRVVVVNNKK